MNLIITQKNKSASYGSDPLPAARGALAGLCLSMLMPSLDTSIANAGLPTFTHELNASFHGVQWIIIAYLLVTTSVIVSVGRLGDLMGRRKLLLSGIGLFTLASLLCGLASELWMLIAARAIQGLGAAIMMALAIAFVSETVPKTKIGSIMGLLGTMSAIGTTFGPSLGGILISSFGWRTIFFVNVPLGILNFFLVQRHLPFTPHKPAAQSHSFDIAGTLLLSMTLAAYTLAATVGKDTFGLLNVGLLCGAFVGAVSFLFVETKVPSPLLQLRLFRNPTLSASLTMSMIVSTVMMTTLVVGPFYLTHVLGLKTVFVGFVLSVGPFVAALTGVPAGRLVDKFGLQRIIIAGLIVMSSGCWTLSSMPITYGVTGYLVPIIVTTAGYALFQAANNTAIMADAPFDQKGVISGMLSLSRNLGLITGASVMGAIFAAASTTPDFSTASAESVSAGTRITFSIARILILIALLLAILSYSYRSRTGLPPNKTTK